MKFANSLLALSFCLLACQNRGFNSGDLKSNATLTESQKVSYVCSLEGERRVEFLPSYGEIHFLKGAGGEFAPSQDGMSFKETILAAIPRKQVMKITDDEGNIIGGWERFFDKNVFQITYHETVYKNCKEVGASAPAPTPAQTGGKIRYVCKLQDDKRVEFIPSYGEVHFLKNDGGQFAQFQDGMRFQETVLAEIPRKQVMKIFNDEDKMIGKWERFFGPEMFEIEFRDTKYASCNEVKN